MKREISTRFREPDSLKPLTLEVVKSQEEEIIEGSLNSEQNTYPIINGLPMLTREEPLSLGLDVRKSQNYYENVGETYDAGMDWLYGSFYENEEKVRGAMVDLLELKSNYRVLETGCGTCRDSVHLLRELGGGGELFLTDLAPNMLSAGRHRMFRECGRVACSNVEFFVSDACNLPFDSDFFDAAYHFGGINLFKDIERAMLELSRVVRPGGKVVIGDEGIAPWLRKTEYAEILINSNPLYKHSAPLDLVPETAKDVNIKWILGNAFYLISYVVSNELPMLDLDLTIPGFRGGTHRSRFYGRIEGVDPEIKKEVERLAAEEGSTLSQFVSDTLRERLDNLEEKND